MDGPNQLPLSGDNRKELYEKLRQVWNLGANVIVGWRGGDGGIEVLYLSSLDLPLIANRYRGLLERERHISDAARFDRLVNAGCRTRLVPLSFALSEDNAVVRQMEAILRYYTVTHSTCRAVALFDIVSFSHQSPFVRISQINILSYHANVAAARLEAAGMPIDLNMSTTGDGFYIWNRKIGLAEDLALFYVTWLVQAFNKAAMIERPRVSFPALRCCFGFGDHYEYYQASGTKPDSRGFIVGDVTINLARLISSALPNQFLVATNARESDPTDGGETLPGGVSRIDMMSFLDFAQNNTGLLAGVSIGGGTIAEIDTKLTGDRISEREYTVNKYDVVDKHGFSNHCMNATIDVTDSLDRRIRCGLQTEELALFDARHIEDEDVRIMVL